MWYLLLYLWAGIVVTYLVERNKDLFVEFNVFGTIILIFIWPAVPVICWILKE